MNEELVLHRDHWLIDEWLEMVKDIATSFPVREREVNTIWNEVQNGENVEFRVVEDPNHVVAIDNEYDVTCHGWNKQLAVYSVVRARLLLEYPPEHVEDVEQFRKQLRERNDDYHPPHWERQILTKDEGEYTESFVITHLEKRNKAVPVEWYGLTDEEQLVYIRYRGGTLKVYVGMYPDQKLAYRKAVAKFPDSRLSTSEMFRELPPWIGYLKSLGNLPEDVDEELSNVLLEQMFDFGKEEDLEKYMKDN